MGRGALRAFTEAPMSTQPRPPAEQYNEELIQAHREALAALRELLAAEKDPLERRRLAIAILKSRPAKDPVASAAPPRQPPFQRPAIARDLRVRHIEDLARLLDPQEPDLALDPCGERDTDDGSFVDHPARAHIQLHHGARKPPCDPSNA